MSMLATVLPPCALLGTSHGVASLKQSHSRHTHRSQVFSFFVKKLRFAARTLKEGRPSFAECSLTFQEYSRTIPLPRLAFSSHPRTLRPRYCHCCCSRCRRPRSGGGIPLLLDSTPVHFAASLPWQDHSPAAPARLVLVFHLAVVLVRCV